MIDFSPKKLTEYARQVKHQRLCWPELDRRNIQAFLRRDDLASSHYPGNKFYKLFYNLAEVINLGHRQVVTFGGAYSNHIHALAIMGKQYNIATVGIIRGHKPEYLSPTLKDAQANGMQLIFLEKQRYKVKELSTIENQWSKKVGDYYLLPEGGDNEKGILGCEAIGHAITEHFVLETHPNDVVCCAVGTGTTMTGIINALPNHTPCLGFSALKGEDTLSANINVQLKKRSCHNQHWQVISDYHHGGYAKVTPELLNFMRQLEVDNNLLLEPVYSAKMLWGIEDLAKQGFWPSGTRLIIVHGGGVQGRRGFGLST